jgi:hypothetical protein
MVETRNSSKMTTADQKYIKMINWLIREKIKQEKLSKRQLLNAIKHGKTILLLRRQHAFDGELAERT